MTAVRWRLANFLKPIWNGRLTATASVKRAGRTTGLLECEVRDERGSLVAYFTSTCLALQGEMANWR